MFKIGDYVINDYYGVVFHLTSREHTEIINAQDGYRIATDLEINTYHDVEVLCANCGGREVEATGDFCDECDEH